MLKQRIALRVPCVSPAKAASPDSAYPAQTRRRWTATPENCAYCLYSKGLLKGESHR